MEFILYPRLNSTEEIVQILAHQRDLKNIVILSLNTHYLNSSSIYNLDQQQYNFTLKQQVPKLLNPQVAPGSVTKIIIKIRMDFWFQELEMIWEPLNKYLNNLILVQLKRILKLIMYKLITYNQEGKV